MLIQHVYGPKTEAHGTPRLHRLESLPEARAPFMLRASGPHISQGQLQNPGLVSGSPTIPRVGPGRPPSAPPVQAAYLGSFHTCAPSVIPGTKLDLCLLAESMNRFYAAKLIMLVFKFTLK